MSSSAPLTHAIQLVGAAHRYGQQAGLQATTLTIETGERVALLGSSGSGKSTLLKLLAGTLEPTGGAVQLWGIDRSLATRDDRRALARRVGLLHQDLHLTGQLRVIHNVNAGRLGEWSTAKALASLVRPADRDEVLAHLTDFGIAHLIDAKTSTLSGGEQQRVALARLARHGPDLILADEPTTGLDPVRSAEAMELLIAQTNRTDATLVVSLHDPILAQLHCTRIVALQDGVVVFDSPAGKVDAADLAALYEARAS